MADNNSNDEVWVTEDGTRIPVFMLSEAHAKNILRMMLRREKEQEDFFQNQIIPELMGHLGEIIADLEDSQAEVTSIEINGQTVDIHRLNIKPEDESPTTAEDIAAAFDKANKGLR